MNTNKLIILLFIVVITISGILGCSTFLPDKNIKISSSPYVLRGNIVDSGYHIADTLINNLNQTINKNDPVIVATFVNVNDLEKSSTFGRIISEQISSRISQRGYKVKEVKIRQNSIFMEKVKGEFLLSRDLHDVGKKHNASAVVVGTYAEGYNAIHVSARIINPSDSSIISSSDFSLQLGRSSQAILSRDN